LLVGVLVSAGWLLFHPPGPDSGETDHWWPLIRNIAHGRGYVACFPEYFPACASEDVPTAQREPVPVLLFAFVARLTDDSLLGAALIEIALKLAVFLVTFSLARELGGDRVATLAGVLWIFYLPALKLIPQVSGDLLATLGVTLGLYCLVRGSRSGQLRCWSAAGLCFAVAGLSRSVALILAPVLAAAMLLRMRDGLKNSLRPLVILGGTFLLGVFPWALRNYMTLGRPIVGSTLTGYNLYRQNYQLSEDSYLRFVAGAEAAKAARDVQLGAGSNNEVLVEDVYRRDAMQIIWKWPLRYLLLSGYRFLILWFGWTYLEAYGASPHLSDYLLMAEQAMLLVLATIGTLKLGRATWPLTLSIIAICLVHMAVIAQLRYLVPVMPLVMVLSAIGVFSLLRSGSHTNGVSA
jgi:4-amino-4-deoxy-L-arabinose transferase-like glycosyltransferase